MASHGESNGALSDPERAERVEGESKGISIARLMSCVASPFQVELNQAHRTSSHVFVYILLCSDGSLYVGQTRNLAKRLTGHIAFRCIISS